MPALASQVSVYLFTPVDSLVPRKVNPSWGQGGERIHSGSQAPWISLCCRRSQRGLVNGTRACVCPSLESSVTLRKGAQLGDWWHRYNSHRHTPYGQARGERPGESQAMLTPGNTSKLPGGFYSFVSTPLGETPTAQL